MYVREKETEVYVICLLKSDRDTAVLACALYYIYWPTNSDSLRQTMNISLRVYRVMEISVSHWNVAEISEKTGKVGATAE